MTTIPAGVAVLDGELLRVLADPLRTQIITLLAGEQLCTSHLVELTGAKQTNITNHLRAMKAAGLLDTEPCGRFTYYRLRPEPLAALATALGSLAEQAYGLEQRKRPCG
jgi:ArsR family transcriptional regulator